MDNEEIDKLFREKLHSFEPPRKQWEAIATQLDAINTQKILFKRRIKRVVILITLTGTSLVFWVTNPTKEIYLGNIAQGFQKNKAIVTAKISPKEKETTPPANNIVLTNAQDWVAKTEKIPLPKSTQAKENQDDTTKPKTIIAFLDTANYANKAEKQPMLETKPIIEAEAESEKIVVTVKLANPTVENEEKIDKNAAKQKTKFGKFLGAFNKMRQGKAYNPKDLQIFKPEKNNEQTKK